MIISFEATDYNYTVNLSIYVWATGCLQWAKEVAAEFKEFQRGQRDGSKLQQK